MKKYIKTQKAIYFIEMPQKVSMADTEDDYIIMSNILYKRQDGPEKLQNCGEILKVENSIASLIIPLETLIEHKPILEYEKFNFAQFINDKTVVSSIGEIIPFENIIALFDRNKYGDFIRYEII